MNFRTSLSQWRELVDNRHETRAERSDSYNLKVSKIDEVTIISLPLVLIGAFLYVLSLL